MDVTKMKTSRIAKLEPTAEQTQTMHSAFTFLVQKHPPQHRKKKNTSDLAVSNCWHSDISRMSLSHVCFGWWDKAEKKIKGLNKKR